MNDRQWGMPSALGSRIPLASLTQTLAVAEHLSFYRAANALGVSQSSVSARIKALEEDLGILCLSVTHEGSGSLRPDASLSRGCQQASNISTMP